MLMKTPLILAINNEALYSICAASARNTPTYHEAVAQMVALLNSPMTHDSWFRFDLALLRTALVKHTRINVAIPSISPMILPEGLPYSLLSIRGSKPVVTF